MAFGIGFWVGIGMPPEDNPLNDYLIAKYLHEEEEADFLASLSQAFSDKREELTLELRINGANGRIIWALCKAKFLLKYYLL